MTRAPEQESPRAHDAVCERGPGPSPPSGICPGRVTATLSDVVSHGAPPVLVDERMESHGGAHDLAGVWCPSPSAVRGLESGAGPPGRVEPASRGDEPAGGAARGGEGSACARGAVAVALRGGAPHRAALRVSRRGAPAAPGGDGAPA